MSRVLQVQPGRKELPEQQVLRALKEQQVLRAQLGRKVLPE